MISPHTPPGTAVVSLYDHPPASGLPALVKGALYTVAEITPADPGQVDRWVVFLREHGEGRRSVSPPWWAFWRRAEAKRVGWALKAFRYPYKAALEAHYTKLAPLDEKEATS